MSRGLKREQSLAEQTADRILSMIQIDGAFGPGDKIPNENDLAHQLSVSRTTLREAIRMLAAHQVLEIRRGRGTFVREDFHPGDQLGLSGLSDTLLNIRDLFEIRLIFEPQADWYAAQRATEGELERILTYGRQAEEKIRRGEDRTQAERAFHSAIASATHNAFINELIPMIYRAIDQAVELSSQYPAVVEDTLRDHRQLMFFLERRNAHGARAAMELHIIHAMDEMALSAPSDGRSHS